MTRRDDEPTTPLAVQRYIGAVLRRKRGLIDSLKEAEQSARDLRREADKAEAHAYLRAQGSIPEREAKVDQDERVDTLRAQADTAEVLVKHLRQMVAHAGDELDGARTAAATLRKEFDVLGLNGEEGL